MGAQEYGVHSAGAHQHGVWGTCERMATQKHEKNSAEESGAQCNEMILVCLTPAGTGKDSVIWIPTTKVPGRPHREMTPLQTVAISGYGPRDASWL